MLRFGVVLFLCVVSLTDVHAQPLRRLIFGPPSPPPPAYVPGRPTWAPPPLVITPAAPPQSIYPPVTVSPAPNVIDNTSGLRVAGHFEPKRDVVIRWNDLALSAIREERTPPPIAAHNLALLHVAIYDAVSAVEPNQVPFAVTGRASRAASAEAAAIAAAYEALFRQYPKRAAIFNEALTETLAAVPEGPAKAEGFNVGRQVAKDVLAWREKNGKLGQVSYQPKNEPGKWQPTPPEYRAALLPEWATLVCLALRDTSQFRAAGAPELNSEAFVAAFEQVRQLGAANNSTRTGEQTVIAYFWADGEGTVTPPGHWNRIAAGVAEKRGLSLADNARLFAMLNVAMADAGVCCWGCKYKCDLWRPVTAIRAAASLKNPKLAADPEWTPLLPTPPFPAYTSGHSTFSGAAAAVLTAFFGSDDVRFASISDAMPGVRRSYSKFSDAANEAGLSRIYGGIHWSFDNKDGLKLGKDIGEHVAKNFFRAKSAPVKAPDPNGK